MENNIIRVEQLPVISERLHQIKEEVEAKTALATSLVCTEDTYKEVKKVRADLNKDLKYWEDQRKQVKAAVMQPYNDFEEVYKECVSEPFKKADDDLKAKISSVENELKANKAAAVEEYFTEYCQATGIDFLIFADTGVTITMSASEKKLKEQVKAFVDKTADDLTLISSQEHSAEILVEYKKSLNVSAAITGTLARIKAEEEEKAKQEAKKPVEAEEKPIEQPVIAAPVEVEKELVCTFTVTATKTKLRELKTFLVNGGYQYE